MTVAVITTSRADYGIYQPLLRKFAEADDVKFGLLVSGTHLSQDHGYTVTEIEGQGYPIWARVECVPDRDAPGNISAATGRALTGFAQVFNELTSKLDYVLALGDRYEMFAAVAATIPYNLTVAHFHGGETTLGAIDEKYRHAISAMSTIHFPSTDAYGRRVAEITGSTEGVYVVGSITMDGLQDLSLPTLEDMRNRFGIDFRKPTILVTMHPETVNYRKNREYAEILCSSLAHLADRYQIVVTLPNADTLGSSIREEFAALKSRKAGIFLLESFGKMGYFAAMKYSSLLLGNTSSGLLEAPTLGRYAINVGKRQKGRARSDNVIDVAYNKDAILDAVRVVEQRGTDYRGDNIYIRSKDAASEVLSILRTKGR